MCRFQRPTDIETYPEACAKRWMMICNIQAGLAQSTTTRGRRSRQHNLLSSSPHHGFEIGQIGLAVDVFNHAPATSNKVDRVGMAAIRGADNFSMLTSSAQVVRLDRSP